MASSSKRSRMPWPMGHRAHRQAGFSSRSYVTAPNNNHELTITAALMSFLRMKQMRTKQAPQIQTEAQTSATEN